MTKLKKRQQKKQQKTSSLAVVQNKPSFQKAKSKSFSPDEQSWMVLLVAFSFKILLQSRAWCYCLLLCPVWLFGTGHDATMEKPTLIGELDSCSDLPCGAQTFSPLGVSHQCQHSTSSLQSSASFTWLLHLLLEPKTLTTSQEGEKNSVGFRVFSAIYLKNACY